MLREEVLKLRELMQQMKAIDVDAQRLLGVLNDTVSGFNGRPGSARDSSPTWKNWICRSGFAAEILRIVQEGW